MKLSDVIQFRKDLYFDGAVQADWFYDRNKAALVSENYIFNGKDYFENSNQRNIDTISLTEILARKFGDESYTARSLAIADYGSGKSHYAVTLGVLFSGPRYMYRSYNKIISNIREIDSDAALRIERLCAKRNLVIVLNGIRDFNLHAEILKATKRSLSNYGVDDHALKRINNTIEKAYRFFDLNSKSRLKDFENAASLHGWQEKGDELLEKINNELGSDDVSFEIINDVFEQVNGTRIQWEEGISAKSILEVLLDDYCGPNGEFDNIIILFDEFGRFLEYSSNTDTSRCGDNALQEIFEASQNANGKLQVINFIQSDIKTYLQRVDQSRNLSRYIGRYDESDKYYISSNLETVFANLITWKNKFYFQSTIVKWQQTNENLWHEVFDYINDWMNTSGPWSSYEKFRNLIVEGIYPMHPISVLMLTKLSDYLQNRSSMNLISSSISNKSDCSIEYEIPLVLPCELIKGDLFTEMLSAETSGRQRSNYCISFKNILSKNEQRLSETQIDVLRANLIVRTLKFKTKDQDDAKKALELCSGLSRNVLEQHLNTLVNDYAIIAYDELGHCYNFTEDAKGIYDYKIVKNRLLAKGSVEVSRVLETNEIRDLGGFVSDEPTDFGIRNKIETNEWCYVQKVLTAREMTTSIVNMDKREWKHLTTAEKPKGKIYWIYINKDTSQTNVDKLRDFAGLYAGMPVVMMLLNDAGNSLQKLFLEYTVLQNMDKEIQEEYGLIYKKDVDKVKEDIKKAFESLKKNRDRITANGIVRSSGRLKVLLSQEFNVVYPNALSFNFNGFLTKQNNLTGNGLKYYCQILNKLLSNRMNYDGIHDSSGEVRSRIKALFGENTIGSWKCVSETTQDIMIPKDVKAKKIYDIIEQEFVNTGRYSFKTFFEKFSKPPYGFCDEISIMFLAVFIAINWNDTRVEYGSKMLSVSEWEKLVVEDKKIAYDSWKKTTIVFVDTDKVEKQFEELFARIADSSELDTVVAAWQEVEQLRKENVTPLAQSTDYKYAKEKATRYLKAERMWTNGIEQFRKIISDAEETGKLARLIVILPKIKKFNMDEQYQGIVLPETYLTEISEIYDDAIQVVKKQFDYWITDILSNSAKNTFETFQKNTNYCLKALSEEGFVELYNKLQERYNYLVESSSLQEKICEIMNQIEEFINDVDNIDVFDYASMQQAVKRADKYDALISQYEDYIDADKMNELSKARASTENVKRNIARMDEMIKSVHTMAKRAISINDFEKVNELNEKVLEFTIPTDLRQRHLELRKDLQELLEDSHTISKMINSRDGFNDYVIRVMARYAQNPKKVGYVAALAQLIAEAQRKMDELDNQWRKTYMTLGDKSRTAIHDWKQRLSNLPGYLSEETLVVIKELDVEADRLLSESKIEDVLVYFDRLNDSEKKRCIELLTIRLNSN